MQSVLQRTSEKHRPGWVVYAELLLVYVVDQTPMNRTSLVETDAGPRVFEEVEALYRILQRLDLDKLSKCFVAHARPLPHPPQDQPGTGRLRQLARKNSSANWRSCHVAS
jgi:hypothetical protein